MTGQPKPRTIFTGDNLPVLRGLDDGLADLIYLDPPFNSNRDYAAPVGSEAAGAAFKDTWTLSDLDVEEVGMLAAAEPQIAAFIGAAGQVHGDSMFSYLTMMATRLIEMRRVLKPEGSIWLHCDDTAGAYLKVLMDSIFGRDACRNEITWKRTASRNTGQAINRISDRLLFYSGSAHVNAVLMPLDQSYVDKHYRHRDEMGRYQLDQLTSTNSGSGESRQPWRGYTSGHNRGWSAPRTGAYGAWINERIPGYLDEPSVLKRLDLLADNGFVHIPPGGGRPRLKRYLIPGQGQRITDNWVDIPPIGAHAAERCGYPTQKPVALMERIITASSNEGEMVLDPFCGCATTAVAAEKLGRDWVGIDLSTKAVDLVKLRMEKELGLFSSLVIHRADIPNRTGKVKLPHYTKHKPELYGQSRGFCAGCGLHFQYQNMTIDHVVPRDKGGALNDPANLQLLCGHCNSVKGGKLTMPELNVRLKELGIVK